MLKYAVFNVLVKENDYPAMSFQGTYDSYLEAEKARSMFLKHNKSIVNPQNVKVMQYST